MQAVEHSSNCATIRISKSRPPVGETGRMSAQRCSQLMMPNGLAGSLQRTVEESSSFEMLAWVAIRGGRSLSADSESSAANGRNRDASMAAKLGERDRYRKGLTRSDKLN